MGLISGYITRHPEIKTKLRTARLKISPELYVMQTFMNALIFTIAIDLVIFLFKRGKINPISLGIITIISYWLFFKLLLHRVDVKIAKLGKEIDRDITYIGRFILIKLSAGRPLINTIVDAGYSYGHTAKYFREIVKDIEVGSSVEEAIGRAIMYSPSKKLRKILFQINNALRVGIDVTKFLDSTIKEIEEEQLLEIKRYGKKINSTTLMYLLFGIVIPSLGLTLASIIGTLVGISISSNFFAIMLLFVLIVQAIFISVYKSIRPNVEI